MHLTTAQTIVWYSGLALELLVCFFALRRKLYREFPIFTAYLFLVAARSIVVFGLYHSSGFRSRAVLYFYWITEVLQLCMRLAAIGELAWVVSRPYPGFRAVLKWVLPGIALALLLRAGFAAAPRARWWPGNVILERELELTAAVVLCVLLALSRLYEVELQALVRYLAAGLLFYSLFQVANNIISQHRWHSNFHDWAVVRTGSFYVSLLIWLAGLVMAQIPLPRVTPADVEQQREVMNQGTEAMDKTMEQMRRFRKRLP
jgi:hypothetical protein